MNAPTHPVPREHLTDEQLAAYIDHGLSLAERNRAEQHLATCDQCVDMLAASVLAVNEIAQRLPPPEPEPPLLGWRVVLPPVLLALGLMLAMALCGGVSNG